MARMATHEMTMPAIVPGAMEVELGLVVWVGPGVKVGLVEVIAGPCGMQVEDAESATMLLAVVMFALAMAKLLLS